MQVCSVMGTLTGGIRVFWVARYHRGLYWTLTTGHLGKGMLFASTYSTSTVEDEFEVMSNFFVNYNTGVQYVDQDRI